MSVREFLKKWKASYVKICIGDGMYSWPEEIPEEVKNKKVAGIDFDFQCGLLILLLEEEIKEVAA